MIIITLNKYFISVTFITFHQKNKIFYTILSRYYSRTKNSEFKFRINFIRSFQDHRKKSIWYLIFNWYVNSLINMIAHSSLISTLSNYPKTHDGD